MGCEKLRGWIIKHIMREPQNKDLKMKMADEESIISLTVINIRVLMK